MISITFSSRVTGSFIIESALRDERRDMERSYGVQKELYTSSSRDYTIEGQGHGASLFFAGKVFSPKEPTGDSSPHNLIHYFQSLEVGNKVNNLAAGDRCVVDHILPARRPL